MRHGKLFCAVLGILALGGGVVVAQDARPIHGVVNLLAPINPDPIIQHSKEIYVLSGCAYCHGVNLQVQNGEAADLYHSALVAADRNGNLIGPLLRQGIAQTPKLSPMPQYSDLSDAEINSIVRWVHYARQQVRLEELNKGPLPAGDAGAGKDYFAANCTSCHTSGRDFAALRPKHDQADLVRKIIHPQVIDGRTTMVIKSAAETGRDEARAQHRSLLERYTPSIVSNLAAYIQSW